MSQGSLVAALGMTQSKISKIEGRVQHITLAEVHMIADALGVDPCELIASPRRRSEGASFIADAFDRLPDERDRRALLALARSLLAE